MVCEARPSSSYLATIEVRRKEVPARIVEIAWKTKGSRLVEETPTRLYAVGTVLEVKARHGSITSSDGELIEAENPRKEDTETGVRILVTNEEMVAILRSMEKLTDSVPVVRSGMPLFTQAEEVFGWREREEVKEAATLASALQAEVNTWLEEGDRFGVEGADEKLAERMAALHVQEMKAVEKRIQSNPPRSARHGRDMADSTDAYILVEYVYMSPNESVCNFLIAFFSPIQAIAG